MKKIFLTGGSGFIGRNILPLLKERYLIFAPSRKELNLLDEAAVCAYLKNGNFDVVIHCANSTPAKNSLDSQDRMLADSLRAYFNLSKNCDLYGKMFYLGSGAEYDKRFDISYITEDEFGRSIPHDDYGFAKYIMNEDARKSNNIYNLRIFGCYGPTDAKTKFIRDAIDCCLEKRAITIRQNCMFDYMYVTDLAKVLFYFIEKTPKFHDYNVCSGKKISLQEIAEIVAQQMKNPYPIEIAKEGWNKEYTASNQRLTREIREMFFTPIEQGIAQQIEWQRSYNEEKSC